MPTSSEGRAGALIAVLNLASLATTITVPYLADRTGPRRAYLVTLAACLVASIVALQLAPGGAWILVAAIGLAFGGLFPLLMTLPLDVGHRPSDVGAVAAMMLLVGYIIGAFAPLGLGAARDLTGSFTTTIWLIAASATGLLVLCPALSRERLRAGAIGRPVEP